MEIHAINFKFIMEDTYYNPKDLDKFGDIAEYQPELAKKFFSYFNYHKDIVRLQPLVITGCSGVGKVNHS